MEKNTFFCFFCKVSVKFDYFGKDPSFFKNINVKEDVYIMRDPFTNERNSYIILGSHCSSCQKVVCVSTDCSLFYCQRYCLPCSLENFDVFPKEIQVLFLLY
ncbi:hypothetical protein HELRODRAFT_83641 [Helobdella robusta]|uniref:Cysteine-rich DPF motif domain-containing protein 1 n=1 Tax=Helobdella robusta TaxID=6412 RepID=T1G585_HELRO|nr:hypothetical protein HELRODRAFT_83641 [Helobdella robusta]ESO00108.1 hypothetical protein HELRODRAFT_83641 [Helobdella robusta]